jgi:hypothetical protein
MNEGRSLVTTTAERTQAGQESNVDWDSPRQEIERRTEESYIVIF